MNILNKEISKNNKRVIPTNKKNETDALDEESQTPEKDISQPYRMKKTRSRRSKELLDLIYISMFTAIIAVCSQICIPTPPGIPPVTLQTFAVIAAGGLLGWKRGTASVLIYILLGVIGIPVFSQFSAGPETLIGMTGGYIIGFIFTTLVTGILCEKLGRKVWVLIASMTLGILLCYAFGTAWFMVVYAQKAGAISLGGALGLCVLPFIPFDAGKIAAAVLLVNRLDKHVKL